MFTYIYFAQSSLVANGETVPWNISPTSLWLNKHFRKFVYYNTNYSVHIRIKSQSNKMILEKFLHFDKIILKKY